MRFKFLQVHFSANTWFRTFTPGLTKVRQLLIPLSGEVYKLYINPILNSWRAYSELIPHKTSGLIKPPRLHYGTPLGLIKPPILHYGTPPGLPLKPHD